MAPTFPPYHPLPSFSSPWVLPQKQDTEAAVMQSKASSAQAKATITPEHKLGIDGLLFQSAVQTGALLSPTCAISRDNGLQIRGDHAINGRCSARFLNSPMWDPRSPDNIANTANSASRAAQEFPANIYEDQMMALSPTAQIQPTAWDIYGSTTAVTPLPLGTLPPFFAFPGPTGILNEAISSSEDRTSAVQLENGVSSFQPPDDFGSLPRPISAGCASCKLAPKLMLFPCQHMVCYACGGKFMIAGGEGMYCACGQLVLSMLSLDIPRQSNAAFPIPIYPAAPQPIITEASSRPLRKPPGFDQVYSKTPLPMVPLQQDVSIISSPAVEDMMMDAQTAIENAPFVEFGRHALAQNWCCVKVSNIPYNVTSGQILEFIGKNAKIVPDDAGLPIHIIMDRATGKTMDAFIEFTCPKDAYRCVVRKRSKILGARHVGLDVVGQTELMKEVFPRARGVRWEGVVPQPVEKVGEPGFKAPEIVTKEELVLVVGHARTPHRSPFSRKCLQRPYESILSIVAKFPWFAVNMYTVQQRDFIFQALVSSIDILKRQCKRGRTTPNLDVELLKRLCRSGINCTGFTHSQKKEIIKIGEFGAEGLVGEIEDDIKGFESLTALGRKRGADSKIVELYGLLSSLATEQFAYNIGPFQTSFGITENQAIESESPVSAGASREQGGSDETEAEDISKLTMAEAAEREWKIIEKVVKSVLPQRVRRLVALSPVSEQRLNVLNGIENVMEERRQERHFIHCKSTAA